MEQIKMEYININTIKPNNYNPKKMTIEEEDEIKKSIERFGIVDPLIINSAENRDGFLIGGHQRYKIYKKLGYKKVPVIKLKIKDIEKEKELCLRLSKNIGSWDINLLANFTEEKLKSYGWLESEMDDIFGIEMDEEFDYQAKLNEAVENIKGVKTGDIWQMGYHKLIVGNSTNKENWERLLGNERFELMETDPPYRIGYGKGNRKQTKGTEKRMILKKTRVYTTIGITDKDGKGELMDVPEYDEWLSIAKDFQNPLGSNIMVFESWKNAIDLWQAIQKYWKIRNQIIWYMPQRNQGFAAKYKFHSKYDIAPIADQGNSIKNQEYEEDLDKYLEESGQKFIDNYEVILYGNKGKSEWGKEKGTKWADMGDHITENINSNVSVGQGLIFGTKPISILIPYIKILSKRGGIVMDPFGGSGSTLIACEVMKRKARLIEINPSYAEVIINRWEKFTKSKAVKIEGK